MESLNIKSECLCYLGAMDDGIISRRDMQTRLDSVKQRVKDTDAQKLIYSCKGYYLDPLKTEHIKRSFLSMKFETEAETKFSIEIFR